MAGAEAEEAIEAIITDLTSAKAGEAISTAIDEAFIVQAQTQEQIAALTREMNFKKSIASMKHMVSGFAQPGSNMNLEFARPLTETDAVILTERAKKDLTFLNDVITKWISSLPRYYTRLNRKWYQQNGEWINPTTYYDFDNWETLEDYSIAKTNFWNEITQEDANSVSYYDKLIWFQSWFYKWLVKTEYVLGLRDSIPHEDLRNDNSHLLTPISNTDIWYHWNNDNRKWRLLIEVWSIYRSDNIELQKQAFNDNIPSQIQEEIKTFYYWFAPMMYDFLGVADIVHTPVLDRLQALSTSSKGRSILEDTSLTEGEKMTRFGITEEWNELKLRLQKLSDDFTNLQNFWTEDDGLFYADTQFYGEKAKNLYNNFIEDDRLIESYPFTNDKYMDYVRQMNKIQAENVKLVAAKNEELERIYNAEQLTTQRKQEEQELQDQIQWELDHPTYSARDQQMMRMEEVREKQEALEDQERANQAIVEEAQAATQQQKDEAQEIETAALLEDSKYKFNVEDYIYWGDDFNAYRITDRKIENGKPMYLIPQLDGWMDEKPDFHYENTAFVSDPDPDPEPAPVPTPKPVIEEEEPEEPIRQKYPPQPEPQPEPEQFKPPIDDDTAEEATLPPKEYEPEEIFWKPSLASVGYTEEPKKETPEVNITIETTPLDSVTADEEIESTTKATKVFWAIGLSMLLLFLE